MTARASNRLLVLSSCKQCPMRKTTRTIGAGYAEDWLCEHPDAPRKWDTERQADVTYIAGYLEWPSEEPKTIPDWCPLGRTNKEPTKVKS